MKTERQRRYRQRLAVKAANFDALNEARMARWRARVSDMPPCYEQALPFLLSHPLADPARPHEDLVRSLVALAHGDDHVDPALEAEVEHLRAIGMWVEA